MPDFETDYGIRLYPFNRKPIDQSIQISKSNRDSKGGGVWISLREGQYCH